MINIAVFENNKRYFFFIVLCETNKGRDESREVRWENNFLVDVLSISPCQLILSLPFTRLNTLRRSTAETEIPYVN